MDANALGSIDEQISINVAASFTADSLEVPLRFWMEELHLWMEELHRQARIQFAPYGQLFQQLLTINSSLSNDRNGISVSLLRLEDWGGASANGAAGSFESEIERNVGDFLQYLRAAVEGTPATFIVCLCPPSQHRIADSRANAFIIKMENYLVSEARKIAGVHVLHHDDVAKIYPVPECCDDYTDRLAHVPYTPVFFTALGTMIARKIYALKKLPHKVIVLDCDYTLWGGACAEDGPTGVQIDSARRSLQEFVLRQHDAGMILCLCSKNNEEDVQAVFDAHPEMLLRRDHFLASRVNWRPKSKNLISLANELNLGLDSFILIDDDPVECGEVRANCPDVLVIQLPPDTESIPKFFDHLWVFDHGKVTAEDKNRTDLYRENFQRDSVRKRSLTFAEFLAELRLEIDISPATPHSLERVSDLTYRTNQFNLSTIRRSESELRKMQREGNEILVVDVRDRFGDYGLVGVIIFQVLSRSVIVDTFLLSCRAMGRGVEQQMLARIGTLAVDRNADYVELRLMPTSKNKPAAAFLESLVRSKKEVYDGGWRYQVPARTAVDCRMDPDRVTLQNGEASDAVTEKVAIQWDSISRFSPHSEDDFLINIAMKLNDPNTIHEVISSSGRVRPELTAPFVAPSSPIEKEIASFWTELLGFEQIGINDNFFDLGGHSLLAMQVLSRIRLSFNVELSPRLLVTEDFTIAALSKAILMEQIRQSDTSEIEDILEKLDVLSVDELRDLIGIVDKK
jgi:FkbH-like protein